MAMLCPTCGKRKMSLLGLHLRGIGGSKEYIDYWCEKCQIIHGYEPKDWVRHGEEDKKQSKLTKLLK